MSPRVLAASCALALPIAALAFALTSMSAKAAAPPVGLVSEVAAAQTALAGSIPRIETRTWTAASQATEIKSAAGATVVAFECVNLSSTPVYVGSSTVAATTGVPYCTDSSACPKGAGWAYDARGTYMIWTGTLNTCAPSGSSACVRCNLGVP